MTEYTATNGKAFMNIRRGMVFQYDLNPSVDKRSTPTFRCKNQEFHDHLQYGKRDWLVVSCDKANDSSPTCTVVPISGSQTKSSIPSHVTFTHGRLLLTILCEQIQTINIPELTEFRYILKDFIMDKVDEALMVHLGIEKKNRYLDDPSTKDALSRVEDIISGIISKRVEAAIAEIEQVQKQKLPDCDITDAVLRIGQGLEDLLGNNLPKVPEEKSLEVVPETPKAEVVENTVESVETTPKAIEIPKQDKPSESTSRKSESSESISPVLKGATKSGEQRKRRKWDVPSMTQFLEDMDNLPPTDVLKRWGFKDMKSLYQTKYSVRAKMDKLNHKKK